MLLSKAGCMPVELGRNVRGSKTLDLSVCGLYREVKTLLYKCFRLWGKMRQESVFIHKQFEALGNYSHFIGLSVQ